MSSAIRATGVVVRLDRSPAVYAPGETLEATVVLPTGGADSLRAAEVSVVWYTAGKGDEDLHVHEFLRLPAFPEDNARGSETSHHSLSTQLPTSPLSYSGVIVKVCWCVRVRLFRGRGRQILVEEPFQIGAVEPMPAPGHEEPEGEP